MAGLSAFIVELHSIFNAKRINNNNQRNEYGNQNAFFWISVGVCDNSNNNDNNVTTSFTVKSS